jgi:hypothetical protein
VIEFPAVSDAVAIKNQVSLIKTAPNGMKKLDFGTVTAQGTRLPSRAQYDIARGIWREGRTNMA